MHLPFTKAYKEEQMQKFTDKLLSLYASEVAKDEAWLADYKQRHLSPLIDRYQLVADMNTPEKKFEALAKLAGEVDKLSKNFLERDYRLLPSQEFLRKYNPGEKIRGIIGTASAPVGLFGGAILSLATMNPLFMLLMLSGIPVIGSMMALDSKNEGKKIKIRDEHGLKDAYKALNPFADFAQDVQKEIDQVIANYLPALITANFDAKYPAVRDAFLAKSKKEFIEAPDRQPQILPESVIGFVKHQKA
jgi:hypothetical protein